MGNLVKKETHILPGIVSAILPGVGQVLKGHVYKAIGIWVLAFFAWLFFSWWIALPGTIIYVVNILDAIFSNDKEKLIS